MIYPDATIKYMSYELYEALAKLSQKQQQLIVRVVLEDKNTSGRTLIPWQYIGKGRMVATHTYCDRGECDEQGQWHGVGWKHQPDFVAAVELAKRRVLEVDLDASLHVVAAARDKARNKLGRVVDRWDAIMDSEDAPARDRIAAGAALVEFATGGLDGGSEGPAAGSEESDWWKAAQD